MHRYILKRLLLVVPTMLSVIILVFTIMAVTPGDPGRMILGSSAPQSAVDALNREFGLHEPFLTRLGKYLWNVLTRFDFGESWRTRQSVFKEIKVRFPITLRLSVLAIMGQVLIGIPLGIIAAVKQYSTTDFFATVFAMMMGAVPGFWLGLMLMLLFGVKLALLPTAGLSTAPLRLAGPDYGIARRKRATENHPLDHARLHPPGLCEDSPGKGCGREGGHSTPRAAKCSAAHSYGRGNQLRVLVGRFGCY